MNTGFGPSYDGLTHLFVTPQDLLQVVALALVAVCGGVACHRAGSVGTGLVGAHSSAGGGKLDRRQRPVHVGLGGVWGLRPCA
jgi:hypothetical protein